MKIFFVRLFINLWNNALPVFGIWFLVFYFFIVRNYYRQRKMLRKANAVPAPVTAAAASLSDPDPGAIQSPSPPSPVHPPKPSIYARAYVIATELHFECNGKAADYTALSVSLPELKKFIIETFKGAELPRNFGELKGFSYKKQLTLKNTSIKGQLKVPFRQIIDHPEIFGQEISDLAKTIYDQHF